jgi:hypothetical protein
MFDYMGVFLENSIIISTQRLLWVLPFVIIDFIDGLSRTKLYLAQLP